MCRKNVCSQPDQSEARHPPSPPSGPLSLPSSGIHTPQPACSLDSQTNGDDDAPSVSSAHSLPRPAPMMALVGVSISGMPGPPLGPS